MQQQTRTLVITPHTFPWIVAILGGICCCLVASVVSNSLRSHGLQLTRLLSPTRQEQRSGFPCPPPGDLPSPGIQRTSPAWQMDSLTLEPPEKLSVGLVQNKMYLNFVCSQSIFFLLKKKQKQKRNKDCGWINSPHPASYFR